MIVFVTTFYELEARFSSHDKGFIENRQISDVRNHLEQQDDQLDLEESKKRIADAKARGEEPIPWEKAKKKLDR